MLVLLLFIPLLSILLALKVYNKDGNGKSILKIDSVRFIYAFVLSPLIFVWLKSFIFYLFKNELGGVFSEFQFFFFDTLLSLVFLYIFAFIVLHALTKTFEVKHKKDPLYDLFEHSEFYHLELSHGIIFGGIMLLMTLISVINVFVPLEIILSSFSWWISMFLGVVVGVTTYVSTWNYEAKVVGFERFIKLLVGLFFAVHVFIYFVFEPGFVSAYLIYWFLFMGFLGATVTATFAEKIEETEKFWDFRINVRKLQYYYLFFRKTLKKSLKK